jgi:hypothetical protein
VTGFAGITLPNKTVILHPDYFDASWLRRHEAVHVDQINRDGPWLWSLKIVWYYIRYGYIYSPYEIEARAAEDPYNQEEFNAIPCSDALDRRDHADLLQQQTQEG